MFRAAVFCVGLILAAIPLAVSAQLAAPTPMPEPSGPPPTPAPPEHFVMVDGAFTGKTFNELAPGTVTGGWSIRAVGEIPIIGHNWAASIDYRSYNYAHTSVGTMANGITFACPAGNPGCVTPIGYTTYNNVFNPGPMNFLNATNAQDSTTQISLGTKIAPIERFYLSVGGMFRGSNYLNYPLESGFGFGLDKLPDVDRTLSFYGNFWLYFNVAGNYTGPTSAALGTLSGYPFTVAYHMYAYRLGVTYSIPHTPIFVDLSDVGDRADAGANAPSAAEHNALMMGAGWRF